MTGPDNQRRKPSAPRGKNMQQRMAEARARRAEVLALQEPANKDSGLHEPIEKAEPSMPSEVQAPVESRFPEIVMPNDPAQDAKVPKSKGISGWLPFLVIALLGGIFGTLYALPHPKAPLTTQTVTTPIAPEQTSRVNRPAVDTPAARAETITALRVPPLSGGPPAFADRRPIVAATAQPGARALSDTNTLAPLLSVRPNPRGAVINQEQLSDDVEAAVRTATQ